MAITIADEKRTAIAMKLADIKVLETLAVDNEERLMAQCDDLEIRKWLGQMLTDDRKNLTILDNVLIQYGIKSEPRDTIQELADHEALVMQGNHLSFYEKVSRHELLKHQLVMAGLAVHKAGQVVGADIGAAIGPLHTLNFENQAHQERLQGILEILSTRELTGQDPEVGIWARIQDSVAAFTGMMGSLGDLGPELKVADIVHLDHQKVRALFKEIRDTDAPQRLREFFSQLYRDLGAHSEAEELTWYAALLKYSDSIAMTEQAIQDQALTKTLLEEIRRTSTASAEFKTKVAQLEELVIKHVEAEEQDLFQKLAAHFSDAEQIALGRDFQQAKSRLQDTKYATITH